MRIKHRLILTVVAFSIAILMLGYFVISLSQASLREDITERSILLTKGILGNVDNTIYLRAEEIRLYAQDAFLREWLVESNRAFEAMEGREAYIDQRDAEWRAADARTPFMESLIANDLSHDMRRKSEFYLNDQGARVFPEIFVTNKYGANVAQTGRTSDYQQNDEDWWTSARDKGSVVQDVEYDASAGIYSTDIIVRVDDDDGNFLGVLKATLRIDEPLGIIKRRETHDESQTTDFKLITGDGRLIYSTGEGEVPLRDVTYEDYFAPIENRDQGWFILKEEDEDFEELVSFSRSKGLQGFEGFGWILLVEQNAAVVFEPVTRLRNHLFLIFVGIVVVGLFGGFILSRSVALPLERLARNSVAIGKGDFKVKSGISRSDEIGTLAASIDKMVQDLKKLEQDKNNFLNIVSHELKTPLTSIFAYLDILEDSLKTKLSKEQREEFATIRNNSDQLVTLINNILEMARMESNKFELIPTEVNVKEKISEAVKSLEPVAAKNGNKLVATFDGAPQTIVTDEQRFKEIFNNLISNAIKFTENGTITVAASRRGNDLFVAVKDTGVGIPQSKVKNLFQKFYQVDASVSRKYGGTGLGLSITREIILRQGGTINVKSIKGKGTTFYFTLPIRPPKGNSTEQKKDE